MLRDTVTGVIALAIATAGASILGAQSGAETFTATATVKAAGGATATAPVTIVVSRKLAQAEADKLAAAFTSGGAAALRKALNGVAPTGSIKIGNGEAIPTRVAIERTTDKGRLLTMVADKPILHLGAGVPGAKPKEGYDFAVLDIEVDAAGSGSGTLAPAARIRVNNGAFVVEDYGGEQVKLAGIKKVK